MFVPLSVCVDYHFNAEHFGKSVLLFSQPGNNKGRADESSYLHLREKDETHQCETADEHSHR